MSNVSGPHPRSPSNKKRHGRLAADRAMVKRDRAVVKADRQEVKSLEQVQDPQALAEARARLKLDRGSLLRDRVALYQDELAKLSKRLAKLAPSAAPPASPAPPPDPAVQPATPSTTAPPPDPTMQPAPPTGTAPDPGAPPAPAPTPAPDASTDNPASGTPGGVPGVIPSNELPPGAIAGATGVTGANGQAQFQLTVPNDGGTPTLTPLPAPGGPATQAPAGADPATAPSTQPPAAPPVGTPAPTPAPGPVPGGSSLAGWHPGFPPIGNTPATPPTTVSPDVQAALDETNAYRAQQGLPPLQLDAHLMAAAQARSDEMAQQGILSHYMPDGDNAFAEIQKNGGSFMTAGENIAEGIPGGKAVVDAWYADQGQPDLGHRKNIMNPAFTKVGFGYTNGYWSQIFSN